MVGAGELLQAEQTAELRRLGRRDALDAARLLAEITDDRSLTEIQASISGMQARWPHVVLAAYDLWGSLVGVITGDIDRDDPRVGWSHDIVVAPTWRGTSLGSRLLKRQLDAFRELGCRFVRGQSPARLYRALPFFFRHGFRIIERRTAKGDWGIADGQELCITQAEL